VRSVLRRFGRAAEISCRSASVAPRARAQPAGAVRRVRAKGQPGIRSCNACGSVQSAPGFFSVDTF
jgi:hypothetical protein